MSRLTARSALLLCLAPALAGCGAQLGPDSRPGDTQQGIASWYGKHHHGRPTANGERFNMYALTAAHRALPFGSVVRVTELQGGRQVVVRINDRGPFTRGRIIDVSYAAARELHMIHAGIVQARLELLSIP